MHVDEFSPYAHVLIPAANSVMFISSIICRKHEEGKKPTSFALAQSPIEIPLQKESSYEEQRRARMKEIQTTMQAMFHGSEKDTGSSSQLLATGIGEAIPKTKRVPRPQPHVDSSPTRQQRRRQQQEIRVLFAGELHNSNPKSPDTHYVHFPIASLEVTSMRAWLGTTILNGSVGS